MPTYPPVTTVAAAYELEASTWLALEGRIPGHPKHDPDAWSAWRHALHAALKLSTSENSPCMLS
jgi:hypothetical protein